MTVQTAAMIPDRMPDGFSHRAMNGMTPIADDFR